MSFAIPDYVTKEAPWSISKVGTLEKCGLQFDYKYHQKIKEQVTFANSLLGKAVHRALELSLEGLVSVDKAFTMAQLEFTLTETEVEQLLTFRTQCSAFVNKMIKFKQKHFVKEVLLEKKLSITSEFKGVGFFSKQGLLRGVVDYALITQDNYAIVIDHKTGRQLEMKDYDTQFRSYCLLMLAQYPYLQGVQTAVNFVASDQLIWNKMRTAEEIIDQDRPWLVNYLANACAPLKLTLIGKKSSSCDYCPYGPKMATAPICTLYGGTGKPPEESTTVHG